VSNVDALNAFLALSPLHQWLGCRIVSHDEAAGSLEVLLPDRPQLHRGAQGAVAHGGVVAALVDIAAHAALHAKLGHGIPTIDMRIDYLRPATLPLTARATVRRSGQNIGCADVEVMDCDRTLSALGRAVFLTRAPSPPQTS
jgi:uncharacterized protein (TIGR00369 family)